MKKKPYDIRIYSMQCQNEGLMWDSSEFQLNENAMW